MNSQPASIDGRRPPRILYVSRNVVRQNADGSGTYLLSLLNYLNSAGCIIEYVALRNAEANSLPANIVLSFLSTNVDVTIDQGRTWRIGKLMVGINSPWGWVTAPFRMLYLWLASPALKQRYRNFKHGGQVTTVPIAGDSSLPTPQAWDGPPTIDEANFVLGRYREMQPDVVMVDYAWLGPLLNSIPAEAGALKVIVTYDVLHQRVNDFLRFGLESGHTSWTLETESAALRCADLLVAIQEEDAKSLHTMAPNCEVLSVPLGLDLVATSNTQVPGRCLFVASRGPHNIQGLHWFLEKIWPSIVKRIPKAGLHICGTICEEFSRHYRNVKLCGRVADLTAEYSEAEVCVVPLQIGSGLKIKLVDALAHGRACVSTSKGLEGLPGPIELAVKRADSTVEFADAICSLLLDHDLRCGLETAARIYIADHLTPSKVYGDLFARLSQHVERTTMEESSRPALADNNVQEAR